MPKLTPRINPHVELIPLTEPLLPSTALEQLRNHDLVLDCTDRPTTRYLVSDAAVALRLPLVSGAAVGAAGQWAVYGGRRDEAGSPSGGERRPCYRCLWPRAGASQRCDDAGVWGPVTGFVGSGMAASALKVLMGGEELGLHVLHLGGSPMVRTVRMRPASDKCLACGPNAGDTPLVETEDYDAFCGTVVVDESTGLVDGQSGERIEVEVSQSRGWRRNSSRHVLTVRTCSRSSAPQASWLSTPVHQESMPSVPCPIQQVRLTRSYSPPNAPDIPLATILATPEVVPDVDRLVFLCRRGNDSQIAAARLRTVRPTSGVQDVRGGLGAWTRRIDRRFPVY
jgi:adenylyltransferase/sulfurtransferase